MTVPMVVGGFGLGICAGAVVLARVAQRTDGSVLAAALWHAGYNMTSATAASRAVIAAVTTTAVMLWAVALLIGAGRHGGRTTLFVETRNNEGALPRRFKQFERIAIAKPDLAPYGRAAVESLQNLQIWREVEKKVIYAQNVSQAKQYAATGNAEAALIPLALVKPGEGTHIELEEKLHQPIDQALGIVKESTKQSQARRLVDFLLSPEGRDLLMKNGYNAPSLTIGLLQ